MRTLIVSDLHLGQRPGHDVLRRPAALECLLAALDDVDRLVLLGDIVELASKLSARRPMQIAEPVLRAIGARLGPEREVMLVPGNHDRGMASAWVRRRGTRLGIADAVPLDASPVSARIAELLAPSRVSMHYPGVWLAERVWATHGHYLDRHLIPETTFGLLRCRGPAATRPAVPFDYERGRRRRTRARQSGRTGFSERPVAVVLEHLAELTRYATGLLHALRLTPITAGLIDLQMRHATLPGMAQMVARLKVDADWVIYGHVHRAGPRDGEHWQPDSAGPRLLNTGSWVYEPLLLDHLHPPHPYWPGGAVRLTEGAEPEVLGLLDELGPAVMAGAKAPDR